MEILSGETASIHKEHREKAHLGTCPIKKHINKHAQFKNIYSSSAEDTTQ